MRDRHRERSSVPANRLAVAVPELQMTSGLKLGLNEHRPSRTVAPLAPPGARLHSDLSVTRSNAGGFRRRDVTSWPVFHANARLASTIHQKQTRRARSARSGVGHAIATPSHAFDDGDAFR